MRAKERHLGIHTAKSNNGTGAKEQQSLDRRQIYHE